MIRANVLCEDRTGGGLALVLREAGNALRVEEGKERIWFPERAGTLLNNHEVLRRGDSYELYRFGKPNYDHVFYIVDARNLWRLDPLGLDPPGQNESVEAFWDRATKAFVAQMVTRARGNRTEEEWTAIASGLHPAVLLWERESLILPVLEELGLGESVENSRRAADVLGERYSQHGKGKYVKSVDGPRLMHRIARSRELREKVIVANPSLREMVERIAAW